MEEENDQLLLNRYRVLSKIGEGASSVVYAAHDTKIGRDVAVKKMRIGATTAPRVLREMRTIATLAHPGIVVMYDFEETPSYYYIIMEYLDGVTLRQALKEQEKLSVDQALTIAIQVCDALEYAHSLEIVHRDIKPENIMLLKNGQVKLMDFGIAQLISRDDRERKIVGTLGYMSPEQITGRYVDETSDIFSLGIILYEMLTGKNPLLTGALKETAMRILTSTPLGPSSVNPLVPEALDEVVLKAMAKDPEERFHSAKGLGTKLREFKQEDVAPERVLESITKSIPESRPSEAPEEKKEEEWQTTIPTYNFVRKHQAEARNLWLGLSLAAFSAFGLLKVGFYPLMVTLLIVAVIPLISYYLPKIALAVAAVAFLPPLFSKSLVHGLLGLIFLGLYYYYFREKDVYAAAAPLFALVLGLVKLEFLYVITVGLLFRPTVTFVTGSLGALSVEVVDLVTSPQLRFSAAANKFLMYPQINSTDFFGSIRTIFQPFLQDRFLLLQILLWGLAALAVSFPYRSVENKILARIVGVILGAVVLVLGYALISPLVSVSGSIITEVVTRLIAPIAIGLLLSFVFEIGNIKRFRAATNA